VTTPSTQERPFSSISIQGNILRENYAPFVEPTWVRLKSHLLLILQREFARFWRAKRSAPGKKVQLASCHPDAVVGT
jgi:hypothetical protein